VRKSQKRGEELRPEGRKRSFPLKKRTLEGTSRSNFLKDQKKWPEGGGWFRGLKKGIWIERQHAFLNPAGLERA